MLGKFRSYQLAVQFYKECEKVRGARHLQDQLIRAAASIALNLAEGSQRVTDADQRRFYRMAMGSTRECQAILDLINPSPQSKAASELGNSVAASVFGICKYLDRKLATNGNSEQRTENSEPES